MHSVRASLFPRCIEIDMPRPESVFFPQSIYSTRKGLHGCCGGSGAPSLQNTVCSPSNLCLICVALRCCCDLHLLIEGFFVL